MVRRWVGKKVPRRQGLLPCSSSREPELIRFLSLYLYPSDPSPQISPSQNWYDEAQPPLVHVEFPELGVDVVDYHRDR